MGKTYRSNYLMANVVYDEDMPSYMKKKNFNACKKHGKNLVVKDRWRINNPHIDFCEEDIFTPSTIKNSLKQIAVNKVNEHNQDFDVTIDDLKINGMLLKIFINPTMNEYMIAIKQNADALIFVKNPNEQIYMEAVKRKGLVLKYIKNPSEKVCFTALNQNPQALQFIENQTEEMIKFAVRKSPFATTMIKKPSQNLYYILLKENVNSYNWMDIKYLDDEFINTAWESIINHDGMMLEKCKKQTFKICEIAIEQNPNAIIYVNYTLLTTKEVNQLCRSAILKNPMTLQYITNAHTNNVIKINIKELSKLALQLNGMAIKYLCDCQQRYDLIKIAINNNQNAYEFIKNRYFKFIFNESAYIKIEKKIDDCAVCYSSEPHFIKYFKCDHLFCRDCIYNTDDIKACPMCREHRVRKVPGLYMN
jgi:hypothetical protein